MAERRATSAASSTPDSASLPELYNPSNNVTSPKAMNRKDKSNHPSTADMVTEAIVHLAERGGSSLTAIKKYITNKYKLDVDKQAVYIKKYLKSAVAKGSLVQTTGRGASGSFKMPSAKQKAASTKTALGENESSAKKSVASMKKKSVKVRASAKKLSKTGKKIPSADMTSKENASPTLTPTEPKSPSKTKKNVKSPTSKPKVPKPKKAAASKSVIAPKKTAVKK